MLDYVVQVTRDATRITPVHHDTLRRAGFGPVANGSGRIPIPTRFERWIRSKLSAITARTPSRRGPLAAQSREGPEPYSLPASTINGVPSAAYLSDAS